MQLAQPDSPALHLTQHYAQMVKCSDVSSFQRHLNRFVKLLIDSNSSDHMSRFDFFVEQQVLKFLLQTLRSKNYNWEYFSIIFHNIQVLIQNISCQSERLYLVAYLHKEGYLDQKYLFQSEDEATYYILLLRSLTRKFLLEDKDYINIFLNVKQPHFPLLYNACKFYNHPESHVVTASNYIVLEMASANYPYLKETYFLNFPFVSYYAHLACEIRSQLLVSIKQDKPQKIQLILMFLEEFVSANDKESINMYASSFFSVVVRRILKLFVVKEDIQKILRFLRKILAKLKVERILCGLRKLFFKEIEGDFLTYLQAKQPEVYSYSETFKANTYLDSYFEYVKQHSLCMYTKNYKGKKGSMVTNLIKSSASYIVINSKGIQAELDRLSEVVGVSIELCQPINHDKFTPHSYLWIFQQQQTMVSNPYFKTIQAQATKKERVYFQLLRLLLQLNVLYEHLVANMDWHLEVLQNCQSVSCLKIVYNQIASSSRSKEILPIPLERAAEVQSHMTQKIMSYVLQEGWEQLRRHGNLLSEPNQQFQLSIFRDIECDILLLMTMNILLGNDPIPPFDSYLNQQPMIIKTTQKVMCSMDSLFSVRFFIKINNQYLQLVSQQDEVQHSIRICNYQIYQDPSKYTIEFVSQKDSSFTLHFLNQGLANYIMGNLVCLRSRARELQQQLLNLYFPVS